MSDDNAELAEFVTFRSKNRSLVTRAVEILEQERPMTLRQLYYRLISAGVLGNSQQEYKRLGNVMTRLREAGSLPRTWIVDHVRSTFKPSSWSGLADFSETVRQAYRKNFWANLSEHVEVFVEKDAIAGTIQPVTYECDVALRVCRGYSSVSFAGEIADLWKEIKKPIFAYYLGDFDPSGFDLERDLREKLERYSSRHGFERNVGRFDEEYFEKYIDWAARHAFVWTRLAVRDVDFTDHNLIALPVKEADRRSKKFIEEYGEDCAEVDALPPTELRRRVEEAINQHINQGEWKQLQDAERIEKESLDRVVEQWQKSNLDSVSGLSS